MNRKIAVAGAGYVGLAVALLLAQNNTVTVVDVLPERVESINRGISPIREEGIQRFLERYAPKATLDGEAAYRDAEIVVVATPTDYQAEKNAFDTSTVEQVIGQVLAVNRDALIVLKSTVPVGFTEQIRQKTGHMKILFSPEFLRETKALYDNLHPSRIIVSTDGNGGRAAAEDFAGLLQEGAEDGNAQILITGATEAEAVKLFANTFLALRVSYFNELDTYAEMKGLNTGDIIRGVCLDGRIGDCYNNPSFGYGGYCLPKDTKQLLANYDKVPQNMVSAIVESNRTRKAFIAERIRERAAGGTIGIYRLTMKAGSDNFRQSSIRDIMESLAKQGEKILIYEPSAEGETFCGYPIEKDLGKFLETSAVVVANRYESALDSVAEKVYTRDVFHRD